MRLIFIFGVILSLASCKKGNDDLVHFNKGIVEEINISSLFSSLETIVLETTDQSIIGEISSIKYSDERIFILDKRRANSVFIFTSYGKFINKIQGGWTGPKALNYPDNIEVINGKLLVYDSRQDKILTYSFDGEFKGEYYLKSKDIYSLEMIGWNNKLVFFDFYSNPESLFELKDEDGDLLLRRPFEKNEYKIISGRRLPYLSKAYNDDVRVQIPGTDCIYQFNGSRIQTICFDLDASRLFKPKTLVNYFDFFTVLQNREAFTLRGEMVDLRDKTLLAIQKGNAVILSIWYRDKNLSNPIILINDGESLLPNLENLPLYNVLKGEITLHFFPGDLRLIHYGMLKEKDLEEFLKSNQINDTDNPILFRLKE